MNLQCSRPLQPLRVLVVNPLAPSSQLIVTKILSGQVFGKDQRINLTLVVFSNEVPGAEDLSLELEKCSYYCTNSIQVSSDVPSVADADVFCFLTNFANPNIIDFNKISTDDEFDTFYLILKVASNLIWPETKEKSFQKEKSFKSTRRMVPEEKLKPVKPILMADGLVALNILKSMSTNLPNDVFFCPTPLMATAKLVLAEYLKIQCNFINDVCVWAANDEVFHIEVKKPVLKGDVVKQSACETGTVGKVKLGSLNVDHTQFSDSWMKKEFIEKVKSSASNNPYGCIFRASNFAKTLERVWSARNNDGLDNVYSLGVISDGSLETIKGLPYVLPVSFRGQNWSVCKQFEEEPHLKLEIRRINKAVKQHHNQLIPYCKNFLEQNVNNLAFISVDEETPSLLSLEKSSGVTSPH